MQHYKVANSHVTSCDIVFHVYPYLQPCTAPVLVGHVHCGPVLEGGGGRGGEREREGGKMALAQCQEPPQHSHTTPLRSAYRLSGH